jgi:uncharacterized protein (TIGR02118 family)
MVLFRRPDDPAKFEAQWSEEFVPLGEKLPGLRRISVGRVEAGPEGPSDMHLIHEFYFDDAAALSRALTSPEGQAAGRALMAFASDLVTLCYVDHHEESR